MKRNTKIIIGIVVAVVIIGATSTFWTGVRAEKGDVPGKDIADMPRYPGTVRVEYFQDDSGKPKIVAYEGKVDLYKVIEFYKINMPKYGWEHTRSRTFLGSDWKLDPCTKVTFLDYKKGKIEVDVDIFKDYGWPYETGVVRIRLRT